MYINKAVCDSFAAINVQMVERGLQNFQIRTMRQTTHRRVLAVVFLSNFKLTTK